jgi:CRP-like cAMP-binding protein
MTVEPNLLQQIPMFGDLQEAELTEIMSCFTEVHVASGEYIYVEGEAATDACFLLNGELEARKALPGGGDTVVGIVSQGGMIGEMALIAGGVRTASVCARQPSTVLKVSYYFFHAALDQMSIPAFKILRAVILKMTDRLNDLQARILEQWDCEPYMAALAGLSASQDSRQPVSFEHRPFLTVMPWLSGFSEEDIDNLLSHGDLFEIPRGEYVFREGADAESCCLIIRGAIERSVMRDRRYQLAVLGPGRLCGSNALIANKPYSSDARVRSQALILNFSEQDFTKLFHGDSSHCLRFQNMVSANQLMQLKAADNLLALLVSQSYVLSTPRSQSL